MKRSPMKRVRRSTGPTEATRELVLARDGGCVACGAIQDLHIHHRKPRRLGGRRRHPQINDVANLIVLCLGHHAWVESYRLQAIENGWLVPEWADPARVPIVHWLRRYVYLLPDGTYGHVPQTKEEPA